ncbi:MAG: putative circadian clock protein KaiC [Candidatus Sulfotelmatobacter sp.]|nr:putative circadian clock protein KaiC [Candidatus Sulfotelmatobacter sp.]
MAAARGEVDTEQHLQTDARVGTGCEGLDNILHGGFPRGRLYLVEGDPGAGKTTLALQFMLEGAKKGERTLYVTLSESRLDLVHSAGSHGLFLDPIEIVELLPTENDLIPEQQYTVFHPAEVELNDRMQRIVKEVQRVRPERLVIDALSELRMLAKDPLRYRRQILSLKDFMASQECTVLLLDDRSSREPDLQLHSVVHGVVSMDRVPREYGKTRRQIEILKLRGTPYREGLHDYTIATGGVVVFPRLIAADSRSGQSPEPVSSGISELDTLTGGGLDRGTSTLLIGPAGCGKTSIAMQWAATAARRGESSVIFSFEEGPHTMMTRAAGLGIDLRPHIASGKIVIQRVDPAEMSPGQLVASVQQQVEQENVRVIIIDSLNGYLQSMPGEKFLAVHLHELLAYLNNRGVLTLMILAQAGTIGSPLQSAVDVSYLADNILLLRYFESHGEVCQAISTIKRRSGAHEHTIRELRLGPDRICIGRPLRDFQGVLTGTPTFLGGSKEN